MTNLYTVQNLKLDGFAKDRELYFPVTEVALMIHPCLLSPTTLLCSPLIMWLLSGCVLPRQPLCIHVSLL